MKLAEALALRSDKAKRLEQLKARLLRNALVQDGETPAEPPEDLLAELERVASEYEWLVVRINLTHATTPFEGRTLTAALAERDGLRLRQGAFEELAKAATVTPSVAMRSKVRFRPTVSVTEIQARADDLSTRLRELDTRIQEANWRLDLRED